MPDDVVRILSGIVLAPVTRGREGPAAFAADDHGWRVGIDLEQLAPRRFDIAARILTPAERAAIADLVGRERDHAVIRAFALKEAV